MEIYSGWIWSYHISRSKLKKMLKKMKKSYQKIDEIQKKIKEDQKKASKEAESLIENI